MRKAIKKGIKQVSSLARIPNKKAGLPPGSVVFTGKTKLEKSIITRTEFTLENYRFFEGEKGLDQIRQDRVQWIDIRGLHDIDLILRVGDLFEIHPLILEDVANVMHRPKFEEYPEALFFVFKSFHLPDESNHLQPEQVSILIKDRLIISFQENSADLFEPVRERLEKKSGRIRSRGSDYLGYALTDLVVDQYFHTLDSISEHIEDLEIDILEEAGEDIKLRLHRLKKELIALRKGIVPLREACSQFSRSEHQLIREDSSIFIRDLYDHTIQVLDILDSQRDTLNGLYDLHLSELSIRMNNVMKVLTIIATIFIPLTFLAGIYGMNFDHMPELHWQYGYYYLLGLMGIIFLFMVWYFRSKDWF